MELLQTFIDNFIDVFIDMSFYIMLGLLFAGILHEYVPREKVLKHLGKDSFSSVVKASAVGVPLPLCSCGVVPTAIELKKDGASNGAVTSFLISTPQTGIDSILATYSMMGLFIALWRAIGAFIAGIVGGAIVNLVAKDEKFNIDAPVPSCGCGTEHNETANHEHSAQAHSACACDTKASACGCTPAPVAQPSCGSGGCGCGGHSEPSSAKGFAKVISALKYGFVDFLDEITGHFLLGMFLATIISTFLPADLFVSLGLNEGVIAMLAMVLVGLPMYICSTASIPVAISLIGKGLSFGGAFVFLFTGPVTNIASLLVLAKTLGKKITTLYLSIVIIISIVLGLLLDFIIATFGLENLNLVAASGEHGPNAFYIISSVIFAVLIVISLGKSFIIKMKTK